MPISTIHIAGHLGAPLEVSDCFGADYAAVDLIGAVVKIAHATVDEIVFEVVSPGVQNHTPANSGGQ